MKNGNTYRCLLLWVVLMLSINCVAQIYNTEVEATISIKNEVGLHIIKGVAVNKTEINQSLRYELSVIKGDKNSTNKSRNSQKGRVMLSPNEQKDLAISTITITAKDRVIILLLVYTTEDVLLGKDRLVLNGNNATAEDKIVLRKKEKVSPDATHDAADGVILRGIVIEDTKTKIGSDFYRMFYIDYLQKNINGKEIVTIKETLAIGNNTQIEILVGREKVVEFVLRPQASYLAAMKDQALLRVRRYLHLLEKNKTQSKKY